MRHNLDVIRFEYLNQKTLIEAGVSDHEIIVAAHVVQLNMMMQCKWNASKNRYNNGFGKIETKHSYQSRLRDLARVLAETIELNPLVEIISLEEAPIDQVDIVCFVVEMSQYKCLLPFVHSITTTTFSDMGIATLLNTDVIKNHERLNINFSKFANQLNSRIQSFELVDSQNKHTLFFNLHLPYDIAKSANTSQLYALFIFIFSLNNRLELTLAGDFNLYPPKIKQRCMSENAMNLFYRERNSRLNLPGKHGAVAGYKDDAVDGIFSNAEQPLTPNLKLRRRNNLFFQSRLFNRENPEEKIGKYYRVHS